MSAIIMITLQTYVIALPGMCSTNVSKHWLEPRLSWTLAQFIFLILSRQHICW